MVLLAVELSDRLHDGLLQVLNCLEVVVMDCRAFQVTPESLDQVQIGCIRGVPDNRQTVPMVVHVLPHGLGMVDGAVVQEEVDVLSIGVEILEQPLQEVQELAAALLGRDHRRDLSGHGIQSAKDRHAAVLPGGWDNYSLATRRPAAGEAGVEVELGLVTVEKRQITSTGSGFFNARAFCRLARATCLGSWRCLRSSLGRP